MKNVILYDEIFFISNNYLIFIDYLLLIWYYINYLFRNILEYVII